MKFFKNIFNAFVWFFKHPRTHKDAFDYMLGPVGSNDSLTVSNNDSLVVASYREPAGITVEEIVVKNPNVISLEEAKKLVDDSKVVLQGNIDKYCLMIKNGITDSIESGSDIYTKKYWEHEFPFALMKLVSDIYREKGMTVRLSGSGDLHTFTISGW